MKDNKNFGPSVKQIILNCKKKCLNLISIFYRRILKNMRILLHQKREVNYLFIELKAL